MFMSVLEFFILFNSILSAGNVDESDTKTNYNSTDKSHEQICHKTHNESEVCKFGEFKLTSIKPSRFGSLREKPQVNHKGNNSEDIENVECVVLTDDQVIETKPQELPEKIQTEAVRTKTYSWASVFCPSKDEIEVEHNILKVSEKNNEESSDKEPKPSCILSRSDSQSKSQKIKCVGILSPAKVKALQVTPPPVAKKPELTQSTKWPWLTSLSNAIADLERQVVKVPNCNNTTENEQSENCATKKKVEKPENQTKNSTTGAIIKTSKPFSFQRSTRKPSKSSRLICYFVEHSSDEESSDSSEEIQIYSKIDVVHNIPVITKKSNLKSNGLARSSNNVKFQTQVECYGKKGKITKEVLNEKPSELKAKLMAELSSRRVRNNETSKSYQSDSTIIPHFSSSRSELTDEFLREFEENNLKEIDSLFTKQDSSESVHSKQNENDEPKTQNNEPKTQNDEPKTQNDDPKTENNESKTENNTLLEKNECVESELDSIKCEKSAQYKDKIATHFDNIQSFWKKIEDGCDANPRLYRSKQTCSTENDSISHENTAKPKEIKSLGSDINQSGYYRQGWTNSAFQRSVISQPSDGSNSMTCTASYIREVEVSGPSRLVSAGSFLTNSFEHSKKADTYSASPQRNLTDSKTSSIPQIFAAKRMALVKPLSNFLDSDCASTSASVQKEKQK